MRIFIALILVVGFSSACAAGRTRPIKTATQDSSGLDDPLVAALRRKDYSLAKRILASGYPVSGHASTTQMPACWAIVENNVKGLRLLIDFGLNVNYDWGKTGGTLLTNAVQFGHLEQVRLLCEAGASVKRNPRFGRSPLHASVIYDHPDIERYLRARGAQYNQWDIEAFKTLRMKPR
jgi:ankyrin repeat protein